MNVNEMHIYAIFFKHFLIQFCITLNSYKFLMIFQGLIFFGFFKLFLNSKHPKNFWHTQGPNDDVCQVDPCADVYPVN